ncbi:hypothetical protein SJA_C1-07770 [Sphingobium indicum UT26S]|uniref:Uncharacterized protein n=1 Tax=Sphingobium indicum (strain DSM 16413 / CCM 7287 / MTCC 6362 / UT26 / NBRC 101211 / UT26S) TaxID=452662 RepID=D4YZ29_SPHIU|nr:hypothetical protein SJA_C1-07770 [Sphingobium indicum UT26S]
MANPGHSPPAGGRGQGWARAARASDLAVAKQRGCCAGPPPNPLPPAGGGMSAIHQNHPPRQP